MSFSQPDPNGFRLGRIFGIDVFIEPWIILPFLFIAGSGGQDAMLQGAIIFVIVFSSVLLHEFGHALAARQCGVHTHRITLGMLGGVAWLENTSRTVWQDLWITIAGPFVNVIIWFLATFTLTMSSSSLTGEEAWLPWVALVARINIWLLWFNLIPAFPMDGGRMLHGVLLLTGLTRWKALYYVTLIAFVASAGIALWGLADWLTEGGSFPIFRLLIAWQVWMTALHRYRFLKQIQHTNPGLAPGPGQV